MNQQCETMDASKNESLQTLIDVQVNMLVELEDRIEILGKKLQPLRNTKATDPCPECPMPFTSVINNQLRQNNARISGLINHINLINQEIEL